MNALNQNASVTFTTDEAPDSYIRHVASRLKRDTGKVFRVNYTKRIGTTVTRIA